MSTRSIAPPIALALALIGVATILAWMSSPSELAQATGLTALNPLGEYSQISLKTMSRDEATEQYVQRCNQDHNADWKVKINFYGKVLDENQQPVTGATANCEWNTLTGTSTSKILSNDAGLFSITGKKGKILGVRVEKDGYYTVDGGQGTLDFEYANPAENTYYEPDANHPVIFHLRKRGHGVALVNKSIDLSLDGTHPSGRVNLMTGQIKPDGVLSVGANKPDYRQARRRYPWSIVLSLNEGGLVETNDQFPFQAPESGYSPRATMDMTKPNSANWSITQTKTYYFFLPSSKTYGRMTVDTLGASRYVNITYSYNPITGQRNLEPSSELAP